MATVRIALLNKTNYDTWKIQMKALLIKNDEWSYVDGRKVKPEPTLNNNREVTNAEAIQNWMDNDEKAMSDIILCIGESELKLTNGCTNSKELWDKLRSFYQSTGPARKATLLKRLIFHKLEEGGDIRDHLGTFFDTVDKLNQMGVDLNEEMLTIILLYSLPSSFEIFRCAIESRDDLPKPESLRIKIIEEYEMRKNDERRVVPNAMVAKKHTKPWQKSQEKSKQNKNNQQISTKKLICHRCQKEGHKARHNCRYFTEDRS